LIEVPYWWDRSYESLQATIYSKRPELFSKKPSVPTIPTIPPSVNQTNKLTYAVKNKLMTATSWDFDTMEPTGWYMNEKYDGMRLYWNGSDFFTRQGKKVNVPDFIQSQMPGFSLDGELWTQYGLYQEASGLCLGKGNEEKWKKAVYWVFDAPDIGDKPYEDRIEFLKTVKGQFIKVAEAIQCKGKNHLKEYFSSIIAKGGEGVMLREPKSLYIPGRSESLRKYKPYFDTEVKVVENNYPHGFNCVQINGKELFVGLSDNYEEARKVKEGTVITVKHLGTNVYGTLQYPKFYRERTDVNWEDLVINPA